jgi:RNA polymerase sigma-70 factor (ECF subfamily)
MMGSYNTSQRLITIECYENIGRPPINRDLNTLLLDDLSIMSRVQAGDKEALGLLYDRYSRVVFSVGLRILRDASEAQDLVQEVFLYVHRKSQVYDRKKSSVVSWLIQVTYSRAFNRRQYLTGHNYAEVDEFADSAEPSMTVESHAEMFELKETLRRALSELTEKQRLTMEMFFFYGYSLREISSQLDETLVNTRHHYYRGVEKLRTALQASLLPARTGLA